MSNPPLERRRNIVAELDGIHAEIKKLKDVTLRSTNQIEELQRGHAHIRRDLANNTQTTTAIKVDTEELITLVKGTKVGIRWGGKLARGSWYLAKWVGAMVALWAVIKYGFIEFIHWLRTL